MNRYNIADECYKEYDVKSDQKYSFMIKDFKIMLGFIFIVLVSLVIINLLLQDFWQAFLYMIIFITGLIVGVIYIIKKFIQKTINWKNVWAVIKRIFALILMIIFVSFIAFNFVINKVSQVNIMFEAGGSITIENAADENFGAASICIYNVDNTLVNKKEVLINDVLRAKESRRQSIKSDTGKEIGRAQEISGEMLYWKYIYLLDKLKLTNGKYYVLIDIKQKNKSVQIINMFSLEDDDYIFSKNSISKIY